MMYQLTGSENYKDELMDICTVKWYPHIYNLYSFFLKISINMNLVNFNVMEETDDYIVIKMKTTDVNNISLLKLNDDKIISFMREQNTLVERTIKDTVVTYKLRTP